MTFEQFTTALAFLSSKGGPVMVILAGLSVLVVAVVFYKLAKLILIGLMPGRHAETLVDMWEQGDHDNALSKIQQTTGYGAILGKAMTARLDKTISRQDAEDATALMARYWLAQLRSGLRFIELTSSMAPLLGLLGTVLGMIEAFQKLADAGSRVNPSLLAGGIWQALLTTAAGMAVALLCVLFLAILEAMLARISGRLEQLVGRVFLSRMQSP